MCDCGRKELSNGICSPRLIKAESPAHAILGLSLDKLLKPDFPQSYLYLSGVSGLVLPTIYYFTWARVGWQVENFFFLSSSGNWWDLNLRSFDSQSECFNHLATQSHIHIKLNIQHFNSLINIYTSVICMCMCAYCFFFLRLCAYVINTCKNPKV